MKRYLIIALLLAVSCCPRNGHSKNESIKTAKQNEIIGIDVSHHNGDIRWDVLFKKDKIQFVFVKATEGASVVDRKYTHNITAARKAGVKVGAYHFLTTSSSAEAQFANFKKRVKSKDIDLIPVLDAEAITPNHPMSREKYIRLARKWADLCIKEYGKAPIIFSSIGFYRQYLKGHFDDCMFWTGNVNAKLSFVNGEPWVIWQRTIRKCHGTPGPVDYNILAKGKSLADISLSNNSQSSGI